MQQLVAGRQGQAQQDTPLGKAQALLYRAFEEPDDQRRVRLAKDALAISTDCADAYVLLRVVPEFVARHPQDHLAREEMTVPVASGPLKLVLSWVADG